MPDLRVSGVVTTARESRLFLFVAMVALSYAVHLNNGKFQLRGLLMLAISLVASLVAVAPPTQLRTLLREWQVKAFVGVALLAQTWYFFRSEPTIRIPATVALYGFRWAVGAAAVAVLFSVVVAAAGGSRRLALIFYSVFLSLIAGCGLWIIHVKPHPAIDVYDWHVSAFERLRAGGNPYDMSMPDYYGDPVYAPGLAHDGVVDTGYQYPPLSLLTRFAGQTLFGDFRVLQLLELIAAAGLLALITRRWWGLAAGGLLLFTPRLFLFVDQGWNDTGMVFGVVLLTFVAVRRPSWIVPVLGFVLAYKQYSPLLLLFLPLLLAKTKRRPFEVLLKSVVLAVAITLPAFLWNPAAFLRSVVFLQFHQPFREDSLSFPALLYWASEVRLPSIVGFGAALLVGAFSWRQAPRSAAGFAIAAAATYLTFFAFNKQAFGNYYLFVLALLACGAASVSDESSTALESAPEPALGSC